MLCLWLGFASGAVAETAVGARYEDPTSRYPHGALGDQVEHATLTVNMSGGARLSATSDRPMVFEDTAPRLADLDRDGRPEILTVEAHETLGARLTVWRADGDGLRRAASTPWIGQPCTPIAAIPAPP
jgi:hypothetical protein